MISKILKWLEQIYLPLQSYGKLYIYIYVIIQIMNHHILMIYTTHLGMVYYCFTNTSTYSIVIYILERESANRSPI